MARMRRYLNEMSQARRLTVSLSDFTRLLYYTALFHLGNRLAFFNSNRKRVLHCWCNGRPLGIEFRQNTGDIAVLYEVFGSGIYGAPYETLGPVRTIVDLGAHIGLSTLYLASLFPAARVVSVEPMPDNFELLRRNCRANGVAATLINRCIGSCTGEVELFRNTASHMHSVVGHAGEGSAHSTVVNTVTMTKLLQDVSIDEIDILKVDIEGSEAQLFADCGTWISKARVIIMEIHPGVVDYEAVIRNITSCGFAYCPPGQFAQLYDVFLRLDVAERARGRVVPSESRPTPSV